MFKHCVWYKITNNYINGIIRYLAIIFNTSNYNAHLTVEAFMDNDNALTLYNIYKQQPIPTFKYVGSIYQTEKNNFYAIQQDFIEENSSIKKVYHVSLAYRVGKEFSEEELTIVRNIDLVDRIDKNDIVVEHWNCDSKNCLEWYKIN